MSALPHKPIQNAAIGHRSLNSIRVSPENDRQYKPIDPTDPATVSLAIGIAEFGVKEPIVVTLDGFIVSGHRRYAAAKLAGLTAVPVRIEPIRRADDKNAFVRLLVEYNNQRVKTLDEVLREEVVKADPSEAYERLQNFRKQNSGMPGFSKSALKIGERKDRCRISRGKRPMLEAAKKIIESLRAYWPLSDRQIHYAMQNDPPLRHASKPKSTYTNDRASYDDLCDILTRGRLIGEILWESIIDETRSVELWRVHPNPQPFIEREIGQLFQGYWRNLQQSQPNHIEILVEKLTVKSIVEQVAGKYRIPVTVARGYCSINPRYEMAERFRLSGRDRLILLMLTDFDPDGETIAESFARSLRDDFGIENLTPIKVALTAKQVKQLKLPPVMKAKAGSSRRAEFVDQYGDDVFELEAIAPPKLQEILCKAIDSVLDIDAYNAEVAKEKEDAAALEDRRRAIFKLIGRSEGDE